MKVILNEDVYNLGEEGDVCDVKHGYARNYLIPRNLAVPYTKGNIAIFEGKKAQIEKRKEEKRKQAMSLKEKLEGITVTIEVTTGESGKLFGSVNNATVAEALEKKGISVERKKIDIPSSSIKMTGTYTARIRLYENEVAEVQVEVVSKDKKEQEEKDAAAQKAAAATEAAEAQSPAEAVVSAADEILDETEEEIEESYEDDYESEEE